jgi:hypothetical protein
MNETGDSPTDAAALGGGVVAVAMTMFADPTPYDILSLVVALTLIILILAYVGSNYRRHPQRLAYSAVLAIIFVPIWGWTAETWKLPIWTKTAAAAAPGADPLASESTVSDEATVAVWALATALFFLLDMVRHAGARRKPGDEASE